MKWTGRLLALLLTACMLAGCVWAALGEGLEVESDGIGMAIAAPEMPDEDAEPEEIVADPVEGLPAEAPEGELWTGEMEEADIAQADDADATELEVSSFTVDEGAVALTEKNFPDNSFMRYMMGYDQNKDGKLSYAEQPTELYLSNSSTDDSSTQNYLFSLTGIQYLTKLEILECRNQKLERLDLSKNINLVEVDCFNNELRELKLGQKPFLKKLDCSRNVLSELDISGCPKLIECVANGTVYGNGYTYSVERWEDGNTFHEEYTQLLYDKIFSNTALKGVDAKTKLADGISLDQDSLEVREGMEVWASVRVVPSDANATITWLSEDPSIATVSDTGLVKGVKGGTTKIVAATNNGLTASASVKVYPNIPIDAAHFPDAEFRKYILDMFGGYVVNGGISVLDLAEIQDLDYSLQMSEYDIKSFKGIEYFTGLTIFSCAGYGIKELDVSRNTKLEVLSCGYNALTRLDLTGCDKLGQLYCFENKLTSLDISKCPELFALDCSGNQLGVLQVSSNPQLLDLHCEDNNLTSLDLSRCPQLIDLHCKGNKFSAIDISNCPRLIQCFSKGDPLTSDTGALYFDFSDSPVVEKTDSTGEVVYVSYGPKLSINRNCGVIFNGVTHTTPPDPTAKPTAAPTAKPATTPGATPKPSAAPTASVKYKSKTATYKLNSDNTATYLKPLKSNKTASVPATVTAEGKKYKVTAIADKAFYKNTKLTKVTIGKNVKTIGKDAFSGCAKLKTVKDGKGVVTIKEGAFKNCKALTAITLYGKVKTVGKSAFYGCKKLKTITIKTTKLTSKTVGTNAFKGIYSKATFKCPKKKLKAYKALLKKKGAPKAAQYK